MNLAEHLAAAPEQSAVPLQSIIDASPDREMVSRYLAEFASRNAAEWDRLSSDPEQIKRLVAIFGFSHFLSEEILRHPGWLGGVSEIDRALTECDYSARLQSFLFTSGIRMPQAADLASFRRKELLRIVLRDVLGTATLAEITEELSNLAGAILSCALTAVMTETESRFGCPLLSDDGNACAAFAVIALGKLGGRELNYSSDVDLMFLYTANGQTSGPEVISNKEFFKKVANQLTNLLSTYTPAGICYRVDLRLRPEGTLGDVSLPLAAAKDYYHNRARDWELQMLIKARVAAGDQALGQSLLDFVEPCIYSTSLDFSTIETMSEARERISEKVARKRIRKKELDVKLAPGGIRDIEFLVQCLQRLHGGREPWVRHGGTLLALARLRDKDLLADTEYRRLVDAYEFLRVLEHRLQFEDDRQTHALPSRPDELERLARRIPQRYFESADISASARLLQCLNQHLENVHAIYDAIVHAQRPLHYGPSTASISPIVSPKPQPREATTGISQDLLRSLELSAPSVAAELRKRGIKRSEKGLAAFVEVLLKEGHYLHLLEHSPILVDCMAQMFELSPFLSEQLTRRPGLLEQLQRAADHPSRRWAYESLAPSLNDIEGLRSFFRSEMFRILGGSICFSESVFQTLDRTSALAEFVIARAYRIAREQALAHARAHATPEKPFREPQSEMMVVALGRLGMREFDLGSDADLLFIIPDSEAERQRFWTRVTEHLIDILTAYAGEGPVLSLDTRLRPNGREGMLVQTESKYVEYFSTKAEAWEGIAYMKARAVAGDTDRATKFLSELQQVDWRRYGQGGRSRQDLRQMRMRLQREQGSATPLKAGQGGYYDADFILMYLRLKGAGLFFKSLNTPERIDIVEKMGHLDRNDAEFLLEATTFFRALDHAIRVVTGRSEENIPPSAPEREMVTELVYRWAARQPSAATLEEELENVRRRMRRLFDSVFAS